MRTIKLGILVSVCALVAGCASNSGDKGPQKYDVVDPPREVTANEAIGFIKSQDDLNKSERIATRIYYPEGIETLGQTNHPTLAPGGQGQLVSMSVRDGESLLSVANRLAHAGSYTRLIFDMSSTAIAPDLAVSPEHIDTVGGKTLFGELSAIYDEQIPGIAVFAADDGDGKALVISDKRYPRWKRLAVYDVREGTLKGNAIALAESIGWSLDSVTGWQADDYMIGMEYPIIITPNDPRQTLTMLLKAYPAQARLNPNTRSVTVVARLQPRN